MLPYHGAVTRRTDTQANTRPRTIIRAMRILLDTPLRTFSLLSLALIALTVLATGAAQSLYLRESILEREGVIIRDTVRGLATEHLGWDDLAQPDTADAQLRLAQSFAILRDLTGAARIKVYDSANRVVWSDDPALIGRVVPGESRLRQALTGGVAAVFDPQERASHAEENLPRGPLVEFYVPFAVKRRGTGGGEIMGALALYRDAEPLRRTIARGRLLLWTVTGAGGLALYGALFGLYRSLYRRQRATETALTRLTTDQARLVQIEKLSAVGQMVGEAAHQLNNPLVGVMNLAQLAEREPDNPPRTRELLADIRRAGEHCRGFVSRMLDFTRLARFERQPVALRPLVDETVAFFRQGDAHHHDVRVEATDDTALRADPVLLRHALFNLLTNAAQADPDGPILVRVRPEPRDGVAGVALAVADRGPGLSPEVRAKLFTPFFTTRPGGTGLGLAVVQHIAVLHGGAASGADNPGGGACFTLWLPLAATGDDDESAHPAD